jgi:addiction module HigA family antidote
MAAETLPTARSKRREYRVRRPLQRAPVHPGALMREILEEHVKMTIAEAARRMKISRPALYAVLNGTAAVTAEMALRFARLTGGAPELYLNMQSGHDLELAQQRLRDELADIKPGPLPRLAISGYGAETTARGLGMGRDPKRRADPPRDRVAPAGRPSRLSTRKV